MAEILGKHNFDQLTLDDDIVLTDASNLDDIGNVSASSPSTDDVLKWNGSAWVPGTSGGGYVDHAESEGESSRTSSTYIAKLTMTTPSLDSGKTYKVGWSFEQKINSTSYDMKARVQVNNSDTLMEHNIEPQDATSYISFGGFAYITGVSGAATVDLDFARETSGTTYMRKARLDIWEAS